MMLIPTYIGPSEIEGLGVFTKKVIEKDQIMWRHFPPIDQIIDDNDIKEAPAHIREYVSRYGYRCPERPDTHSRIDGDDGRFMNHSDTPNIAFDENVTFGWATRLIAAGEELTCNYRGLEEGSPHLYESRHLGDSLVRANPEE